MNNLTTSLTLQGCGETIRGVCEISEGKLRKGGLKVIVGLSSLSISSKWNGTASLISDDYKLMNYSLQLGAAAVTMKGITKLIQGVKKGNLKDTITGTLQTTGGCISVIYLSCLDSKVMEVAHRTILLNLVSGYTSWTGVKDIANGRYQKGCFELLLGVTGMLFSGAYAYSELSSLFDSKSDSKIPPQLESFLKDHESEIAEIYKTKEETGKWRELGQGVSKKVFTHPDTEYIIKIPLLDKSFWGPYLESDNVIHYWQLQKAANLIKEGAEDYSQLTVPKAFLIQRPEGPLVIEKRLHMKSFYNVSESSAKDIAVRQLYSFLEGNGYCDINVKRNHNAQILSGSEHKPVIGLYDLDCNENLGLPSLLNKIFERVLKGGSIFTSAAISAAYISGEYFAKSEYAKTATAVGIATGISTLIYTDPTLALCAISGFLISQMKESYMHKEL